MIHLTELRRIARERLKDAEALLAANRFDGAIYVGGYVVEIALKHRICRTLKWEGFPQTNSEFKGYQSFRTHDLDVLLSLSGAEQRVKANYFAEWSAVSIWDPEARYNPIGTADRSSAELLVESAKKLLRTL